MPNFAGTIVARNYVAQAKVLCDSFTRHHPDESFQTLLVDGVESDRTITGIGTVVLPEDLGMDPAQVSMMRLVYTVVEFSTALKPTFLQWMFSRGAHTATYIDPDIQFFAPIHEVFALAFDHGMVLTPHLLEPYPDDGRLISHAKIMHSGMYNLGFISVGPDAARFIAWWRARLVLEGFADIGNALFTDQRWIDWAPSLTSVHVSKHKGLNVAYWNLHERPVAYSDADGWSAGGTPLHFFHFSGFDPSRPTLVSKYQGESARILFSEAPALQALCAQYSEALAEYDHDKWRALPYRHDWVTTGLRLSPELRKVCRSAWEGNDPLGETPPDPWLEPTEFTSWCLDRVLGHRSTKISRLELALWVYRTDLQGAFPDVLGDSAPAFVKWIAQDAGAPWQQPEAELDHNFAMLQSALMAVPQAEGAALSLGGWSVVGYGSAELGVGEASRRIAAGLAGAGLPWEFVGLTRGTESRQSHRLTFAVNEAPRFANQIMCVNADQTPGVAASLGERRHGAKRYGLWFFEVEDFPENQRGAFDSVDEVWVASEFCRAAIQPHTDKVVRIVPLPAERVTAPPRFTPAQVGLDPNATNFVTVFDYLSVLKRKNPLGAIEAYREAFAESDGARLIVKSVNGVLRLEDRELVRFAASGRSDIVLLEDYMSTDQLHALIAHSTCLVSLHRSEGYGLNLVDAMARGVPTIATAYSGNLEFQDESSAFLVPWSRVEIGRDASPYPAASTWAEPDLDVAAQKMLTVVNNQAMTSAVVAGAFAKIDAMSAAVVGEFFRNALVPELAQQGAH